MFLDLPILLFISAVVFVVSSILGIHWSIVFVAAVLIIFISDVVIAIIDKNDKE